jgi:hypothetical protein
VSRSALVILFILVAGARVAMADTFEAHAARGDSLYEAAAFAAAAREYESAFDIGTGRTLEIYNAACSWALAGEPERAFAALDRAAEAGYADPDFLTRDPDLVTLHEDSRWEPIVARVRATRDEIEKDYDKPLKERLERILVRDQALRRILEPAEGVLGRESDEMRYFIDLMLREDSLNVVEVLEIIDANGWPGTSLVGPRANSAVWLVIQHAPLETQQAYLPLLRRSVAEGESSGSHLAMLEDRVLMRTGRPQTYGSQIRRDPETGENQLYLLADPHGVNARREAVGLGPIESYIARWDLEWDPDAMAERLAKAAPPDAQ